MKLLLIRHGEADYSIVQEKHYLGMGYDMATLSLKGKSQAQEVSKDPRLKGAEIIISSPYPRALETASIISKNTGLDIIVENDLHEWSPDLTYRELNLDIDIIKKEMRERKGKWDATCRFHYEEFYNLGLRGMASLKKYLGKYDKVIVVAHGYLFNQFVFNPIMQNCEIEEYELTKDSTPLGFIDPWKIFEENEKQER